MVKVRSHHTQHARMKVLDTIVRMLAPAMPEGAKDTPFRAVISVNTGATPKTVAGYLNVLQAAGRIEWDNTSQTWKLPQ